MPSDPAPPGARHDSSPDRQQRRSPRRVITLQVIPARGRARNLRRRGRPDAGTHPRPASEVDSRADTARSLALSGKAQRSEGVAYSSAGDVIAVATSDTNTVFLFRRKPDGQFDTAPYWGIKGAESPLDYPNDVSFALSGSGELMAVAQRGGAIAIYRRDNDKGAYGARPIFEIGDARTKQEYSDGAAFVPPDNRHVAVCNLKTSSISFYRKIADAPVRFDLQPVFELRHRSLAQPDGLAFSQCGRWLAVANHGNHTVSIFRRRARLLSWGRLRYGPRPVTVISDPSLRDPHSVAFSPETNHLVVTAAGANYFRAYAPIGRGRNTRWSQRPVLQTIVDPDAAFRKVNLRSETDGPKGIAIHRHRLAIRSAAYGVKIYSLRETSDRSK